MIFISKRILVKLSLKKRPTVLDKFSYVPKSTVAVSFLSMKLFFWGGGGDEGPKFKFKEIQLGNDLLYEQLHTVKMKVSFHMQSFLNNLESIQNQSTSKYKISKFYMGIHLVVIPESDMVKDTHASVKLIIESSP